MMVGRAKDHFERWQADEYGETDTGFRNILNKVKDYARRRKLDSSAKGQDVRDMDIGDVGEKDKHKQCEKGECDHDHGKNNEG